MRKLWVIATTAFLFAVPLFQVQADSNEADESQKQWNHYTEQWQEHMNTMQEQMDMIHQTTDPAERQRLLEEHWKTMDAQMRDMRMMAGMRGGMMGDMHGRNDRHHNGGKQMMDPEQRDRYTQDRIDMMQMMMEQMMQHDQMMMREGMH